MHYALFVLLTFIFRIGSAGKGGLNEASTTNSTIFVQHAQWLQNARQDSPYAYDRANINGLKLVQVHFRHGRSNPNVLYPTDPHKDKFKAGLAQLVPIGKRQGYELGTYLRHRYSGFISQDFRDVYTESTNKDRAIMTAEMVLSGLFPVKQDQAQEITQVKSLTWQPIPVRTTPEHLDNWLWGVFDLTTCPKHGALYADALQKMNISNSSWIFDYIRQKGGYRTLISVEDLMRFGDTLMTEELNNLRLPKWVWKVYPEHTQHFTDVFFTVNASTTELVQIFPGPLNARLVQNMELNLVGAKELRQLWTADDLFQYHFREAKMYLMSSHDTTMSLWLTAFGIYDNRPPVNTAAIILELHSNPEADPGSTNFADYTIQLFYKQTMDRPIRELHFSKCLPPCNLQSFITNYKDIIVGDGRRKTLCQV